MPGAADDLTFGFDTSFFEKGINKVTKGLEGLQTTTQSVAKGVSKGLTAVAVKFGSVFAGVKAIQGALKNMPEIGQAFGIAKDVFLKNLLFPLRKQIFPLLQKMLDWVRDSRGMFIRWGQSIANVFKAVVSGVKTIISFIRRMSEQVAGFINNIFGTQIKNISDVFDLLTFKLATVIQFVSLILEDIGGVFTGFFGGLGDVGPSLKGIIESLLEFLKIFTQANDQGDSFGGILSTLSTRFGEIVGFVVRMTDKFLEGFVPAVSQIATPLQKILDAWLGIQDAIFAATSDLLDWPSIFESLGNIVGTGIQKTFEFIATVLEDIESTINSLKDFGFVETIKAQTGNLLDTVGGAVKGFLGLDDNDTTATAPLAAVASAVNNNQSQTQTITISPTIIIEEGTIEAGENVATGFIGKLQSIFNSEFERGGR